MARHTLRYALVVCLLISAAFAAWAWFRPYAWGSDPAARCKVVETLVTRDQAYYWVDVHLEMIPGTTHDLRKPVRLETATGKKLEPADTTVGGMDGQERSEMWFKFWLESKDLAGPLTLFLNDGKLTVKTGSAIPDLGNDNYRNFTTQRW